MSNAIETAVDKVKALAETLEEEVVELTRSLIQHPSEITQNSGDEGPAQRFLAAYLEKGGYDYVDVFLPTEVPDIEKHPGWKCDQNYENRPNVVAVRRGTGNGRSIILNGHMDVVPRGDETKWQYPPFSGTVKDGYLYGRGACDMKGGIAVMVMAVEVIHRAGIKLAGDVIVESVVAEENGIHNGTLACCLRGYKADGAVVLEPTKLDVCAGHKGNQIYQVQIPGKATHSCLWWSGASAIDHAIYFKEGLKKFEEIRTKETRSHPLYSDSEIFPTPALVDNIWFVEAGKPHFLAVPDQARIMFMVEVLPGEERNVIKERFENFMAEWCSHHPFLKDDMPSVVSSPFSDTFPVSVPLEDPLVTTLVESIEKMRGKHPVIRGFESACDAMTLMMWGNTPSIMYGPGNLKNAHEIDEKVSIAELKQAVIELAAFIVTYCGVNE
ncbi:ArgE/DapE family deacylase [Ammoniphilus sp. YIM 78166]|uniref:ArgE/DapE family deacylase n=1 Tax=Ammoniphilus sp. YIM 78166 TaxID=1644106 RepID=UPI00107034E3|nr:ArgE/DapE family deacylase [Ammoniphilus sp. YIM 78166]